MQLIKGGLCSAASVAMILGKDYGVILRRFQYKDKYPFPPPDETLERVPSMEEICRILWVAYEVGLVPFPKTLICYPTADSNPYSVWDGDDNFKFILRFGAGLLEGMSNKLGHLCAWDGEKIYDPRGHIYLYDDAHLFNFEPTRFWLKV